MNSLNKIFIYRCRGNINFDELVEYIVEKIGEVEIKIRKNIFSFLKNDIAKDLASMRIISPYDIRKNPLPLEVAYEKNVLKNEGKSKFIYDGIALQKLLIKAIPKEERSLNYLHLIFTNRLFATLDDRYHIRVILCGYPTLISPPGVVEGLAKPREFYFLKGKVPTELLKEEFKERYIEYDDERLTDIMKRYVMQAIFYHWFLEEPFCDKKYCRLYNAHWQEEVIAQLKGKEFCAEHQKVLNRQKDKQAGKCSLKN